MASLSSARARADAGSAHPGYRPDIDGLRAIAVLSVVAFHAVPETLPGGFVGVDVFFVISGFLISSIILEQLAAGRLRFVDFYGRRIRRIFPALSLVLLFCLAIGWFALLADEYEQLGKHVAAGAGFVSNLVLWSESGYFDNRADTKPLLHLWSLGVEEQFYLVWPVLLWLGWHLRRRAWILLFLVGLVSFFLNIRSITVSRDAVADFYSPVTRFWELALGAGLAYAQLRVQRVIAPASLEPGWPGKILQWFARTQGSRPAADGLSVVGLALVLGAPVLIDRHMRFPGWVALLPTLGAALLIAAGPGALIGRKVLGNRILVGIGLGPVNTNA